MSGVFTKWLKYPSKNEDLLNSFKPTVEDILELFEKSKIEAGVAVIARDSYNHIEKDCQERFGCSANEWLSKRGKIAIQTAYDEH
jgi:hypothetical protein